MDVCANNSCIIPERSIVNALKEEAWSIFLQKCFCFHSLAKLPGFRVKLLGFRVKLLGFRVKLLGFWVEFLNLLGFKKALTPINFSLWG